MDTNSAVATKPAPPKARNPYAEAYRNLKRNKAAMAGLFVLLLFILCAIFADYIAPFPYELQNMKALKQPPSLSHLLGTDNYGRDILSRIIYGARISLMVGFIAVSFSALTGGLIGALAGFYRGRLDNILMRFVDTLLAIPSILLAIAIVNILGPGLVNVMIAVGISTVPSYARVVRAAVLSIRDSEFIEAAQAIGDSNFAIIMYNILPNCMAPIIVQATLGVASAILSAASLSFLGLGLRPPTPEWGAMLSEGRQYIFDAPWLSTYPGLAILIVVLALNIFGDGLRDAFDPRLKK
ncbi:MAG: ABC transporter permease [Clostridiales bacterium]|nr:ABC transporter permease [Clostridiales bacterium]